MINNLLQKCMEKAMAGHLICVECGRGFRNLYSDPRVPPVDVGNCMCWECTDGAHDEVVETAEEEFDQAKEEQTIHQEKSKL